MELLSKKNELFFKAWLFFWGPRFNCPTVYAINALFLRVFSSLWKRVVCVTHPSKFSHLFSFICSQHSKSSVFSLTFVHKTSSYILLTVQSHVYEVVTIKVFFFVNNKKPKNSEHRGLVWLRRTLVYRCMQICTCISNEKENKFFRDIIGENETPYTVEL